MIRALTAELMEAGAKLAAVRAIHRVSTDGGYCVGCWEAGGEDGAPSYPCPTIRALLAPSPAEREGEGHVWWDADHDRKADAYTPPERAYCRQCGVGRSFAVDLCHVAVSRGIREPAPAPVSSGEAAHCDQCGGLPGECVNQDTGEQWGSCYAPNPAPVVTPSIEGSGTPE